jgi:hypothetical protein
MSACHHYYELLFSIALFELEMRLQKGTPCNTASCILCGWCACSH